MGGYRGRVPHVFWACGLAKERPGAGFRRVVAGTTFRLYASHKLQCDPMRVSKRFTHDKKIGLLKYQPKVSLASRRIGRPFRPLSLQLPAIWALD